MFSSVTHGTLLCRNCAKSHAERDIRAFGIKSFTEDRWSLPDVLSLLEGGNSKFREFCAITNSYPNLESVVGDKKQFFDGLYASNPVKAYRSLLRKAVARAQNDREFLLSKSQCHQPRPKRDSPVVEQAAGQDSRGQDSRTYAKEVPMLSVYDFHTTVIKKKWPGSVDNKDGSNELGDDLKSQGGGENEHDKSVIQDSNLRCEEDESTGDEPLAEPKNNEKEDRKSDSKNDEREDVSKDNISTDSSKTYSTRDSSDESSQSCGTNIKCSITAPDSHIAAIAGDSTVERIGEISDAERTRTKAEAENSRKSRGAQQQLSSVPETMATVDSGKIKLGSVHDKGKDHEQYDDKSVFSLEPSIASSAGSLELKSIDSRTMASIGIEGVMNVNNEGALAKKLETTLTSESLQDTEESNELTNFKHQGTDDSVRNFQNSEQQNSYACKEDSNGSNNNIDEKKPLRKISSLQKAMEKLLKSIEKSDTIKKEKIPTYRERENKQCLKKNYLLSKGNNLQPLIKSKVIPGVPSKRTRLSGQKEECTSSFIPRLQRATKKTEYQRSINKIASKGANGKLGPPVKKRSDYTPMMRHSLSRDTVMRNDATDELGEQNPTMQRVHTAYRHRLKRLSKSFRSHGLKPDEPNTASDSNLYIRNNNLVPRGNNQLDSDFSKRRRNVSNGRIHKRSFVGSAV